MNGKICRDCGKQIIGRRADAIICKDCRRKAQEESSQKIKEQEKEKRIWRKVEASGVKTRIEYRKVQEILKKLRNRHQKDEDELREVWFQITGLRRANNNYPYSFGMHRLVEEIELGEMKPFWEFIEKKVKEKLRREIIKIKIGQNNKIFS